MDNKQSRQKITIPTAICAALLMLSAQTFAQTGIANVNWYHPDSTTFNISTANELAGLAYIVNGTLPLLHDNFAGKTVNLTADVNLSSHSNWHPIGFSSGTGADTVSVFAGTFDGGGYIVRNLTCLRVDSDYVGLFGSVRRGVVKNVGLEGVNIAARDNVGAVAGSIFRSRVVNCYAVGSVVGRSNVGGLVGQAFDESEVANGYTAGIVSLEHIGGGVVGVLSLGSKLSNCYTISSVSGSRAGGVVGEIAGGSAANCAALNFGVVGSDVRRVAALAGGEGALSNNAAYAGMVDGSGSNTWSRKGANSADGADLIELSSAIGGRFTAAGGWTTQSGRLPGLFGKTVEVPEYLRNIIPISYDWYKDNPAATRFEVSNARQLAALAAIVNGTAEDIAASNFTGKTIALVSDIDLTLYDNWVPIGSGADNPFSGTFDGDGYIISNLTIERHDADNQGLFGRITGGKVENLGLFGVNIAGGNNVGGVVGAISGGSVVGCYSTGIISGNTRVGGVVGEVLASGSVSNSYSASTVSGNTNIGGVVGYLNNGSVSVSYSIGEVTGVNYVGGVAGFLINGGSVANCAALNTGIKSFGDNLGRIATYMGETPAGAFTNNVAYNGIAGEQAGADRRDGQNITAADIEADSTISGLFTGALWTTQDGYLPGLLGMAVTLPEHLTHVIIAVAETDRIIPQNNGNDVAVIAPVKRIKSEFTAGPNPISKSAGKVNFYYRGQSIKTGTLVVHDASGNIIKKIRINDNDRTGVARNAPTTSVSADSRRIIGSWDLTDTRGRQVPEGTYLIRGAITTPDGKRERVSQMVGVR